MQNSLYPFFFPKGVAVIGASSNPNKLSFGIFKNLTQYGYQGGIYPVNPNARDILGLRCYADIRDVPDPVDLAVSVVAAQLTPGVLEACGKRGIKTVVIISGGFREVGAEGALLEERCLAIARQFGMRLIGPNCVGTMDLHSRLDTTFIYGVPDKGHIAFISQSGAICGGIVDYVRGKKVGFSNFSSLGNEADVTETDVIEYLAEDANTRVITAYVEAIQDGRRFMEVVRKVSKTKPVVLLKAGKTRAGAKAVSSHTGAIAGSMAAYQAAFLQSGVIEAATVADLFDIALALDSQPVPAGKRVAILTNSGGPAALASDSLAANGLELGNLSGQTQAFLRERLVPSAQVGNPVDMLGGAEPADYGMALAEILKDPEVDSVIPILVPQALIKPVEVANELIRASEGGLKPVVACFMGDEAVVGARQALHEKHIPMYTFPETPGIVLGAMIQYNQWRLKGDESIDRLASGKPAEVRRIIGQKRKQLSLGEIDMRPVLQAYGIPIIPGCQANSSGEAVEAAAKIGQAVAMKIVSPDLLHKSDAGGIRLGLSGETAVRTAYQEMMATVQAGHPEARLEGVLIEAMAPKGVEVIVGMRRDPNFGPLLMFGLGGIYVELFADVAFRIAPIGQEEAIEMIRSTHAGKLLSGFRGQPPADLIAVADCIRRLGEMALDFPEIEEAEVNPLLVFPEGQGVLSLDCRAILGGK